MEWLKPFIDRASDCEAGEVLVTRTRRAEDMLYIVSGRFKMRRSGMKLTVGATRRRTACCRRRTCRTQNRGNDIESGHDTVASDTTKPQKNKPPPHHKQQKKKKKKKKNKKKPKKPPNGRGKYVQNPEFGFTSPARQRAAVQPPTPHRNAEQRLAQRQPTPRRSPA